MRFQKGAIPDSIKRHLLSWYLRNELEHSSLPIPILTENTLQNIASYNAISLVEKIDALLLAYANSVAGYADEIEVNAPRFIAKIQAKDATELSFVRKTLIQKNYLENKGTSTQKFRLSSEGWIHAESLRKKTDSTQAFIAMWFHADMNTIYETGIAPAFNETGIRPFRIDKKEHNDKIDDQIIAEIQRSRFMVADFTGHRGGVYFEAGYAMGRGIPVIWMCKKCCLGDLHFDIRQYNMIDWLDAEDLRARLHQRIRATLGERQ